MITTPDRCARPLPRLIDAASALVALIVLSPLLVAIAAILRCCGEHRVLFRQQRVGQHETPFTILKFLTIDAQMVDSGTITRSDDPGVLAFGRVLRRTKLNELPQLWNVLRGDMALVGPRPLPRSSFEHYPLDARQVITTMKPGLTGIGSVFFHDEERMPEMLGKGDRACYLEDIMPLKAELELWYARHRSVWIDVKIIAATCAVAMAPHARFYVTWFPVEHVLRGSSLYGYFMNSLSRAAAT